MAKHWLNITTLGRQALLTLLLIALVGCTPTPAGPQHVTIRVDGQEQTLTTQAGTVREALTEAGIRLDNLDYVQPSEITQLEDGMTIEVTRVIQTLHTVTETVPFGRQVVRDSSIALGESRLLQSGQPGVREYVYRITQENGVETENTLVRNALIVTPVDEVQLVGTRPRVETAVITGTLAYLENQDAWVMRSSSNNRRRLTSLGDLDGRIFTLSPDGELLLFSRAVSETDHINELWLISTTQAEAHPLPLGVSDALWADWDPAGERIAWTTAEVVERAPGWRGQNDLWIATLNRQRTLVSRRQLLAPEAGGGYGWWGTRYVWSPDGAQLACSRPDSVGVVVIQGAQQQALGAFPGYRTYSSWAWNPGLGWSPDGNFVAAVFHGPDPAGGDPEESPVFDLWLLEATDAYSANLASEVGMWSTPQFRPDGETLLFGRSQIPHQSGSSGYMLCTIDRDGSNERCHYPPAGQPGVELPLWAWNPDGESIAFIQWGDIYLLRPQDDTTAPITDEGSITAFDWK